MSDEAAQFGSDEGFLVGAFGEHWFRSEVDFRPGKGTAWQILGCTGNTSGAVRVCDFRTARGIYILHDDHGPRYVGMARGSGGLGARLAAHDRSQDPKIKPWTRFSWYTFDDVTRIPGAVGWWQIKPLEGRHIIGAETAAREMEALVMSVLGTWRLGQRRMGFDRGGTKQWRQVTGLDTYDDGVLQKVDRKRLLDARLRHWVEELD